MEVFLSSAIGCWLHRGDEAGANFGSFLASAALFRTLGELSEGPDGIFLRCGGLVVICRTDLASREVFGRI